MNQERLDEIRKAKAVICSLCESDMCEWCRVECLVEAAKMRCAEDEPYIRSSTNGDYSQSDPWDAPGMSISNFI